MFHFLAQILKLKLWQIFISVFTPYIGFYFSFKLPYVLKCIEDVVVEWEALGLALQLPYRVIKEIEMDKLNIERN